MKQFKHGCWDHNLVLQLELKIDEPLDFADFLLHQRTEEDKRATKLDLMHCYLGASKAKSSMNVQSVAGFFCLFYRNASVLQSYILEPEGLREQVTELQIQLIKKSKRQKIHETAAPEACQGPPKLRAEAQAQLIYSFLRISQVGQRWSTRWLSLFMILEPLFKALSSLTQMLWTFCMKVSKKEQVSLFLRTVLMLHSSNIIETCTRAKHETMTRWVKSNFNIRKAQSSQQARR